jgi:hypothetical protein
MLNPVHRVTSSPLKGETAVSSEFHFEASQPSKGLPIQGKSRARLSALSLTTKTFLRNWAGKICRHAVPAADFKKRCRLTGHYDGTKPNDYQ